MLDAHGDPTALEEVVETTCGTERPGIAHECGEVGIRANTTFTFIDVTYELVQGLVFPPQDRYTTLQGRVNHWLDIANRTIAVPLTLHPNLEWWMERHNVMSGVILQPLNRMFTSSRTAPPPIGGLTWTSSRFRAHGARFVYNSTYTPKSC